MEILKVITSKPKTDDVILKEWESIGFLWGILENDKLSVAKLLDDVYQDLSKDYTTYEKQISNFDVVIFPIVVRVYNGIKNLNEDNYFRHRPKSEEEIKNTIENLDYRFIMDEFGRVYNDVLQLMEKIKPIGADFEAEACAYCADHIIHMIFHLRKKK